MPYVAGKRERNKAANRAEIVEAGRHCFIEFGYEAVSVRDIIRATNLATGTFYNYFQDKREVLIALLESRMEDLTLHLTDIRRNAQDMRQFVYGAYYAAFETIAQDPLFYLFISRNTPVVQEIYNQSVMGISVSALEADIRDAINRGVIPEIDVEYLAAAFFGVGFEIGRSLANREKRDPKPAAEMATRIFMEGVAESAHSEESRAVA